jgi:predicted Zn-dependent protease
MRSPSFLSRVRRFAAAVLGAIVLLSFSGCDTVQITGRRQFLLVGENTEVEMGVEAYKQALEKAQVSTDKAQIDLVRRVGMRIAEATQKSDYKWEFTVIEDPKTVNAWCLPGGKVAVYTGILQVTQDEAGLATVLGHEVSHAIARHGAERMTQNILFKGGETALSMALQNRDPKVVNTVMGAFGLGSQYGFVLPFGRKQESEADRLGLIYMARAGYDPEQAVEFWKRMSALGASSAQPPEFFSTHPSHEHRVRDLQKWMSEAKAEHRPITQPASPGGTQ